MDKHSLMVILAHPDDESFPIGGTLARYAVQGTMITLITATSGERGVPGMEPRPAAVLRDGELRMAAAALGVAEVHLLGYPDNALDQAPQDEVRRRLRALMITHRPNAVITFGLDGISGHPDHLAIHRLTTEAFDDAALPDARLYYIAPSEATRQGCGVPPTAAIAGDTIAAIDVGAYRETKVRAMQCHASQHPPFGGPPTEEAEKLACHEYFTLARPAAVADTLACLFAPLTAAVLA